MKKSLISLLSLTALMSITGCGGTKSATSGQVPFKPSLAPTEIRSNSYSESLYVGESFSPELLITPLLASDAEIVYTSSDENIATVNEKGVITAKSAGEVTITFAAKKNLNIKNSMSIRVFENNGDLKKANTKLKSISLYQKVNKIGNPKKLLTEQVKTYYLYKNDALFSVSEQHNNIIVDKDNGYVYFGGRDVVTKINDGNTSRSFGVWQIYTDEDYHSYIYHDTEQGKKYLPVATEFNLGTDKTRIDTVYGILDSLFTIGNDLVENCIEDSMGGDWYDYSGMVQSYGEDTENLEYSFVFASSSTKPNKSTPTMETNLDIPAYSDYYESDYARIYWDHGVVKSCITRFTLTYYVHDVKHTLVIQQRDTFTRDDFVIDPIKTSEYVKADDIYDL